MDITKNNNRNCLLDILKLACAFLVVCIHTPFKGSEYLAPYTKVAVPIFFMISGWFYSLTVSRAGYEHTELYISTIVSAGAVFILMVTARDHNGSVAAIALARRGRELSLGIFIVHPIFMHLLVLLQNSCRDRAGALATMLDYTMPILVFFLSVITVRLFKPVSAKLMASVIGKKAP